MEKKLPLLLIFGIFLTLVLFLNLISAIDLEIEKKTISSTVIADLNEPAVFEMTLTNLEEDDTFEIYSLVGIDIFPKTFQINSGQTKKLTVMVMPAKAIATKRGFFAFEYKIKNSKNEIQNENMNINIIPLEDAFEITIANINPKSEQVEYKIKNKAAINFKIELQVDSTFIEYTDKIDFPASGTEIIQIPLDTNKLKTLDAGNYLANSQIKTRGIVVNKESIIKYLEQGNIETIETKEGVIVHRHEIIKRNQGNIKNNIKITTQKNLLAYLFTTINIPAETNTKGFTTTYTWEKELIPNEEFKLIIKTNWWFPVIIIILIIVIIIFIIKSIHADLELRKKVSFVKTKGGQFALKVSLKLKSKRFLERINIIDKLPQLVKLYDKFGAIPPHKIDLDNRRLEWNVESLNKGEERIFTYIIYSKIGVVGRFELPNAKALYEKNGKVKETTSNRSFFINEPKKD